MGTKSVRLSFEPAPDVSSSRVIVYLATWGVFLMALGLYQLVETNR